MKDKVIRVALASALIAPTLALGVGLANASDVSPARAESGSSLVMIPHPSWTPIHIRPTAAIGTGDIPGAFACALTIFIPPLFVACLA